MKISVICSLHIFTYILGTVYSCILVMKSISGRKTVITGHLTLASASNLLKQSKVYRSAINIFLATKRSGCCSTSSLWVKTVVTYLKLGNDSLTSPHLYVDRCAGTLKIWYSCPCPGVKPTSLRLFLWRWIIIWIVNASLQNRAHITIDRSQEREIVGTQNGEPLNCSNRLETDGI